MDWTTTLERLKADRGNWANVAAVTGLTRMQVSRIASGETQHPRIDTAQKIADYYDAQPREPEAA
jgi:transcriptional regulator with XRE-family HTH domain